MRSLRILMVSSEGPPTRSGIARTIGYLRDGLQDRGHRVDVISHPGVQRVALGEVRLSRLIFHLTGLARRIDDYDLVHLHGAAPTVSDAFLLFARIRGLRPPLVYTHHCDIDMSPVRWLSGFYNTLHHRLSAGVDQVVSTTSDYATEVGVRGRISIIPLGVDFARFATGGPKDRQFTVLFAGQFRPYKGVRVLLRAMASVQGARLLVAGGCTARNCTEEQDYRALAAELGVYVEFHTRPGDDHLRELYRRAHAVVLPSVTRAEAFGLVLLEGMAAGCVPVASDLPGVRDVVAETGFTFPVGDVDGLATTLRRLRDEPALVEQSGARARERASTFTWERTVSEYERLFVDLVVTRELRSWLMDRADATGLRAFLTHVARSLEAEWAEVLLRTANHQVYRVGSAAGSAGTAGWRLTRAAAPLARYSCDIGQGVLLESGGADASWPLTARPADWTGSAVAVPLTADGSHFGAMLALRERPFARHDLDRLTRLAGHAAPKLRAWHNMVSIPDAVA